MLNTISYIQVVFYRLSWQTDSETENNVVYIIFDIVLRTESSSVLSIDFIIL